MNKTVREILSEIPKAEKIYYKSNPGNAGDALIATGTFTLLDDLGLGFEFIHPDGFDATGKIVVYAGGGNLNHIYSDAASFIKKHHMNAKLLIILPHTITENQELLEELGPNCILFAREEVTANYLQNQIKGKFQCYIDHDMATHIDKNNILKKTYPSTAQLIWQKAVKKIFRKDASDDIPSIKKLIRIAVYEAINSRRNYEHGNFFRIDIEASGNPIPPLNADLSIIYELSTRSRKIIDYTTWRLLKNVSRYNSMSTDRLHICMAGALLGKNVTFYGNSYFKCKAVYDFTIKNRYRCVVWESSQSGVKQAFSKSIH